MPRHGIGQQVQRSSAGSIPHDRITIPQICSSRSLPLHRPRQSALRYPAVAANRSPIHSVQRDPPLIHEPLPLSANLLDRLNSNHTPHPRHSNPHSQRRATHVPLPRFPPSEVCGRRPPVCAAPPSWGRHPQTFMFASFKPSAALFRSTPSNRHSWRSSARFKRANPGHDETVRSKRTLFRTRSDTLSLMTKLRLMRRIWCHGELRLRW